MAHRRRHDQQQLRQVEPLCCVGSRCPSLPSDSTQICSDTAWDDLLKATTDSVLVVKEVIKSLQDDGPSVTKKKAFGKTKSPLPNLLTDRLMKVSSQLTSLHAQIGEMKNRSTVLNERMRKLDDSAQLDVIQKVDDLTSSMQKALTYFKDDETRGRAASGSKDNRRVSFGVSKASMSCRMEEEKDAMQVRAEEKIKAENEKLRKELEEANISKQTEKSAIEQVERYKELKRSDHALQVAQEQQRELAKQLEIGRLKFLEEVSTEIEDTVMGSLSKADAFEKELHLLQKDYETKTRECEQKLQEAEINLQHTMGLRDRLARLEEERLQILSNLDLERKEKEDARAEVYALSNDIKGLNEQMSKLKAEHLAEVKEMQDKVTQLEIKEQEMEQLVLTLDRTSAQLETQQAINVVLMKKKEEMEWLFLEAKAEKENLQKQYRRLIPKSLCHT
ncbi:hypothetical protein KP509_24G027500 [Ceratopteris richardii]|uniref:Uncharacterized protein n=1 Tax=Ceratopteris richardii TaxID=49495 RepID=A0A8T2RTC4_CERRI|nr:hypothetical protein KP509_24G027500 [Ceratopteris richardii]